MRHRALALSVRDHPPTLFCSADLAERQINRAALPLWNTIEHGEVGLFHQPLLKRLLELAMRNCDCARAAGSRMYRDPADGQW